MKIEYKKGVVTMTQKQFAAIMDKIDNGVWEDFSTVSMENGRIFLDGMEVVQVNESESHSAVDRENIFKGARFGDKFKTKDGRCAVLVNWGQFREYAFLYVQEGGMQFYGGEAYNLDGSVIGGSQPHDIIGRWEE